MKKNTAEKLNVRTRPASCPFCSSESSSDSKRKTRARSKGKNPRIRFKGVFKRASNPEPIQRYQCLECNKSFSDATFSPEYRQRRRDINGDLFRFLVSNVSMRRAAMLTKVHRRTVERRMVYFAKVSKVHNEKFIQSLPEVESVVFDDMESSIHTKLKPVSIPMVVEKKSRLILAFDVVSMPAKGRQAAISVKKYGKRPDHRKIGWQSVLTTLRKISSDNVEILSDSHKCYPPQIRKFIPNARHSTVLSRRACVAGQGELKTGGFDPLFSYNHTAAMVRSNANRMNRRTWGTSKKIEGLHGHLAMYQLWHNEIIMSRKEGRSVSTPFDNLR
jgi:transposase-like protein